MSNHILSWKTPNPLSALVSLEWLSLPPCPHLAYEQYLCILRFWEFRLILVQQQPFLHSYCQQLAYAEGTLSGSSSSTEAPLIGKRSKTAALAKEVLTKILSQ